LFFGLTAIKNSSKIIIFLLSKKKKSDFFFHNFRIFATSKNQAQYIEVQGI